MKPTICLLTLILSLVAVQASPATSWEDKIKDLETKFSTWVHQKAQKVFDHVKTDEAKLKAFATTFIANEKDAIKSAVETVQQDIEVLKSAVPIECYKNASRDLITAEEEATKDLLECQNMSQAYSDIANIAQQAYRIALYIAEDVKVIIQGVAVCGTKVGVAQFECVAQYVAEEVKDVASQWPEAKQFIQTMKVLGADLKLQIDTCLNTDSHKSIDKKIQEALDSFNKCSQQTMF